MKNAPRWTVGAAPTLKAPLGASKRGKGLRKVK